MSNPSPTLHVPISRYLKSERKTDEQRCARTVLHLSHRFIGKVGGAAALDGSACSAAKPSRAGGKYISIDVENGYSGRGSPVDTGEPSKMLAFAPSTGSSDTQPDQ